MAVGRLLVAPLRHPRLRWARVVLAALVGVNAGYGGIGLALTGLGMPQEWLDGTPFDSWLLPGMVLLVVVAVPMTVSAVAEYRREPWAPLASLSSGLLLVGWIVVQLAVLQRYFFLQPVLAVAGLALTALAWPELRRHR